VSEAHDRGVDIEVLAPKIEVLRQTALRYAQTVTQEPDAIGGAGLDLEIAAIRYVRKLDNEVRRAHELDYVAIVEQAERDRDRGPADN
jgi:hypothetical protein